MKSIYHQLVKELQYGLDIQTGTLISTKGSAPQIPGAMAIFNLTKVIGGTLGGGILEAQAQKAAHLASEYRLNTLQWVHFNAEMDDEAGAICGGSALFLIESNPKQQLEVYLQVVDSINQHQGGALLTLFRKEEDQELVIEKIWLEQKSMIPEHIDNLFNAAQLDFKRIIEDRNPCWTESVQISENPADQISIFVEPIYPTPQLLVIGAGHIGQALCKVGHLVDFEVTVIDDRPDMANSLRFPDAHQIICKPIAEGFESITIYQDSYIVIATQGHRSDMEALQCCIRSDAAYIGVIGSKRKTALMSEKFVSEGWASQDEWNFIHTPVGLDIHSKSVNEIAISIVAELIKERYEINFRRKRRKVSSIVLAAGKSSRMGQQKLLLPLYGKSMIKSIIEKIANSNSSQTIVVTRSQKEEIIKELSDCVVHPVVNDKFEDGMLSSVQAGVADVNPESEGMIILLGDQPMVSETMINRLISVFQKTGKGLLIPTFNGKRGHPVLISSKYKESINSLNPDLGLRELFIKYSQDILEIEVETDNILKDIDTPEDYKREYFPDDK